MPKLLKLSRQGRFQFPNRNSGFDPSHPAAQGITLTHGFVGFPATSGSGAYLDFLNAKLGSATGPGVATTLVKAGMGVVWNGAAGTCGRGFSGKSTAADANVTLATIAYIDTLSANHTFFTSDTSTSGGCSFGVLQTTGAFHFTLGGRYTQSLAQTTTANRPFFCAVSANTATGTINAVVVDLISGKISTSTTTHAGAAVAPNGSYGIGIGSVSSQGSGIQAAIMFAPTFLSLSQLRAWAEDPWAFWYPRSLVSHVVLNAPPQAPTGSVGAAAGTGAASATSQAIEGATAAATGAGAATATGAEIAQATAAAAGNGAASAIGRTIITATASAAGTGAAAATSLTIEGTTASAAGTGAATGQSSAQNIQSGVGAAAGNGAASATGQAVKPATAAAAGTGAATATGQAITVQSGTAAAAGSGAANGNGRALWQVTAAAAAVGTATGFSAEVASVAATAAGVGSANGIGAAIVGAIANAAGLGAANAAGLDAGFGMQICGDLGATMTIGDFGAMMTTEQLMATMSVGDMSVIIRCH